MCCSTSNWLVAFRCLLTQYLTLFVFYFVSFFAFKKIRLSFFSSEKREWNSSIRIHVCLKCTTDVTVDQFFDDFFCSRSLSTHLFNFSIFSNLPFSFQLLSFIVFDQTWTCTLLVFPILVFCHTHHFFHIVLSTYHAVLNFKNRKQIAQSNSWNFVLFR